MMDSRRAVIFDLDGTRLDSLADIANATNTVLEELGLPVHPMDAYRKFVGDGIRVLVERAVAGSEHLAHLERALLRVREVYAASALDRTRPYPGIPALLDALAAQKIPVAILSNKPHDLPLEVVAGALSSWTFSAIHGSRNSVPRKPHPAGALEIARELDSSPGAFLYVGDTDTDMRTAINASMVPVGVSWGFRGTQELLNSGARHIVDQPAQILDLL